MILWNFLALVKLPKQDYCFQQSEQIEKNFYYDISSYRVSRQHFADNKTFFVMARFSKIANNKTFFLIARFSEI
jgi:hypothetical protein